MHAVPLSVVIGVELGLYPEMLVDPRTGIRECGDHLRLRHAPDRHQKDCNAQDERKPETEKSRRETVHKIGMIEGSGETPVKGAAIPASMSSVLCWQHSSTLFCPRVYGRYCTHRSR